MRLFERHKLQQFKLFEDQLNLFACLHISVQTLTKGERKRYHLLSVFPEDVAIPVDVICYLWMMEIILERYPEDVSARLSDEDFVADCKLESREFLEKMVKQSLVISRRKTEDSDEVFLHDLQLEYLKTICRDSIPDLQRVVLRSVWERAMCTGYFNSPHVHLRNSFKLMPYLKEGPFRRYEISKHVYWYVFFQNSTLSFFLLPE